jgi:hypothetical protein
MMVAEGAGSYPTKLVKDGREWRIGSAAEVAWIGDATAAGLGITAAVPAGFAAYCTVALPDGSEGGQRRHDQAVVATLQRCSVPQPWWLGYLEIAPDANVVFFDAPRVELYYDWGYVFVEAGPDEALSWRDSEGPRAEWKGALPDLMFPADHSWLFSTLWDDFWSCLGGSEALIASLLHDRETGARTRAVALGEDPTPPGHAPH